MFARFSSLQSSQSSCENTPIPNCQNVGMQTALSSIIIIHFISPADTCKVPSLSRLADNVTLALDADLPERILNGTELKFGCIEGLALVKGGVLTCGDDGIWQGDLPECARK